MKANGAPEKIFLRHNHKGDIGAGWLIFPLTNNDIEYTRTDAFIEKACSWLKSKGGFTIGFDGAEIKDFKNYMEGE